MSSFLSFKITSLNMCGRIIKCLLLLSIVLIIWCPRTRNFETAFAAYGAKSWPKVNGVQEEMPW